MNNIKYWTNRYLLLEQRRKNDSEKLISNIQNEFNTALKDIQKGIDDWYKAYATENTISIDQAKKVLNRKEKKGYIDTIEDFLKKAKVQDPKFEKELRNRYIKSRINRLEAIKNQTSIQIEILGKSQDIKTFNHLIKVYENSYYESLYDLGKGGLMVNFNIRDTKLIESICRTPWSSKSFSERVWGNNKKLIKEVRSILSQGVITGIDVHQMSKKLAKRMDVASYRAKTLIRTETNFVLNQATADSYEAAELEEYQFLATLDTRTSTICQKLDNKTFKVKDKMVGVNYPPMHPNCRSTTIPFFREDIGTIKDKRTARDHEGNAIMVDYSIDYAEWFKKYIQAYV